MKWIDKTMMRAVEPLTNSVRMEMIEVVRLAEVEVIKVIREEMEKASGERLSLISFVKEIMETVGRMEEKLSRIEEETGKYLEERRRTNAHLASIAEARRRDVSTELSGVPTTRPVLVSER